MTKTEGHYLRYKLTKLSTKRACRPFENQFKLHNMIKKYSGVIVPAITPFNADLSIDTLAVANLMKRFAANGLHPLVLGTTGESPLINTEKSIQVVQTAVANRGEGQLIYAGLVGNQLDEMIDRGNRYIALGADVVVATLPSYYILTPDQMERFYTTLADQVNGPVMMYNIKATTQMSIPVEVVDRLSNHPNIAGLKDSERDEERMLGFCKQYRERPDFSYFCGWGARSAGSLEAGADGIVPSTGNLVPEMYGELYKAALEGRWDDCKHWQAETDKVAVLYQKDCTLGESLKKLKTMMKANGWCTDTMMPPLY